MIGQLFGVAAIVLGFLSYQTKTSKKLLIVQMVTCAVFCVHYLLIGAISAFVLNGIGLVRNIVYANRDKKIFSYKFYPVLFAVIMGIMGALSWQNIFSVFIILGLVINTLCLCLEHPQNIRKSILVTSPLVIIYNISVLSIGGIIYESVSIISSIIGIFRYHKTVDDKIVLKNNGIDIDNNYM